MILLFTGFVLGGFVGFLVGLVSATSGVDDGLEGISLKEHKINEALRQSAVNKIVGDAVDKLYEPKATLVDGDDPVLAMKYETEESYRKMNPHIAGNENEK